MATRGGTFRPRWWHPPPLQEHQLRSLTLPPPAIDAAAVLAAASELVGVGSRTSQAAAVLACAASISADGQRIAQAAADVVGRGGHRNIVPNPDMTGAVVGVLGSGGSLPTGWSHTPSPMNATISVESFGTLPDGQNYIDIRIAGTNNAGGNVFPGINFVSANSLERFASQGDTYFFTAGAQLLSGTLPASSHAWVISEYGANNNLVAGGSLTASTIGSTIVNNGTSRTLSQSTVRSIWAICRITVVNGASVDVVIRYVTPYVQRGRSMGRLLGSLGNQDVLIRGSDIYRTRDVAAVLAASASIEATGEVAAGTVYDAAASFVGSGAVASMARRDGNASASLLGSASVSASTDRIRDAAAMLGGAGVIAAVPYAVRTASASLSGNGASLGVGGGIRLRSAVLAASGSLSATPAVVRGAEASLAGSAAAAAAAVRRRDATAALAASAAVDAAPASIGAAAALLQGGGAVLASPGFTKDGSASLAASASLSATARPIRNASASLGAAADLSASAEALGETEDASASIGATAAVAAQARRERAREAALAAVALVVGEAAIDRVVSAHLVASAQCSGRAMGRQKASSSNALNLGI